MCCVWNLSQYTVRYALRKKIKLPVKFIIKQIAKKVLSLYVPTHRMKIVLK